MDLRKKMPEVIAAVERHEHVIITCRGKRKAVLIPYDEEQPEAKTVADCVAFGMWQAREDMADVEAYVDRHRATRGY